MPRKFSVQYLPGDILSKLNRRLIESDFSEVDSHVHWLHEQGFAISRSSLHRYGVTVRNKHEHEKGNPALTEARIQCLKIAASQCAGASPEELTEYADYLLKWTELGSG